MGYVAFIAVSIGLFAIFLLVTQYERARGVRFLASARSTLDARVEHAVFVLTHVDFGLFVREELRVLLAHITHDIAHLSLKIVRAVERVLTRLVRHLRSRHAIETNTTVAPRAFVKTMNEFKQQLSASPPRIPEI